jgi:hypothetical protein
MDDNPHQFLSSLSGFDFGTVSLSNDQIVFHREMNDEIISLCRSLPKSSQTSAFMFLMNYSGISFGSELNFFRNYYAPAWSVIYWIAKSSVFSKELKRKDIDAGLTVHSMAMFLHSLDDHLNDGQIPVSHLVLLLRSQSWCRMNSAFERLSDGVDGGSEIVQNLIDGYYGSIAEPEVPGSLDDYCDFFIKQMGTWLIVPVLLTKKIGAGDKYTDGVRTAYGSFGIAWRLLDDIRDTEKDMLQGLHSSVYICLPEDIKKLWDKAPREEVDRNSRNAKTISNYVSEHKIIEGIKERICTELKSAASIADSLKIPGLAHEFHCLLRPLHKFQGAYEQKR